VTQVAAAVTMLFSLGCPLATKGQCSVERFAAKFPAKPSCFFNRSFDTLIRR